MQNLFPFRHNLVTCQITCQQSQWNQTRNIKPQLLEPAVVQLALLGNIDNFVSDIDELVRRRASDLGFTAIHQTLEIEGICRNCSGD